MQRIAPHDKLPTHPECDMWLTDLMIDLKLRAAGEEYTNFPTKRLQEWQNHREGLTCWDVDPANAWRLHGKIPMRHGAAVVFFDALVMDIAEGVDITTERVLHIHFADWQIEGEWFQGKAVTRWLDDTRAMTDEY